MLQGISRAAHFGPAVRAFRVALTAATLVPAVPRPVLAEPMACAVARFCLAAQPYRVPLVTVGQAPAAQIAVARPMVVLPAAVQSVVDVVAHPVHVVQAVLAARATVLLAV